MDIGGGQTIFDIPTLIECDVTSNNCHEKPARQVADLSKTVDLIPPNDDSAYISLIIGKDLLKAHLDQIRGISSHLCSTTMIG